MKTMKTTMIAQLVTLTACAADAPRTFVGSTEDQRPVEISIDGDSLTAEIGNDESFLGEASFGAFRIESDTGAILDGVVAELVVGSFTDAAGDLVEFTATESGGFGELTQGTSTTTTASGCVCNTTYHRVYCRRTDGSWYWNQSYC